MQPAKVEHKGTARFHFTYGITTALRDLDYSMTTLKLGIQFCFYICCTELYEQALPDSNSFVCYFGIFVA